MGDDAGAVDPASLVQGWFDVRAIDPGIFAIVEPLHSEQVKSYLIVGLERALLLDTGTGAGDIRSVVEGLTVLPVFVVNSRSQWDHIGGNWRFPEIWIHQAEADRLTVGVSNERMRHAFAPDQLSGPLPDSFDIASFSLPPTHPTRVLLGGEAFNIGGRTLEVLHCPGHPPGGIALLDADAGVLFSTDVAYPGALYAFGNDADLPAYLQSLDRLAPRAPVLRTLMPAHCASPMDPGLLPTMRDVVAEIVAGRRPESIDGPIAHHQFDGFSVHADAEGAVG